MENPYQAPHTEPSKPPEPVDVPSLTSFWGDPRSDIAAYCKFKSPSWLVFLLVASEGIFLGLRQNIKNLRSDPQGHFELISEFEALGISFPTLVLVLGVGLASIVVGFFVWVGMAALTTWIGKLFKGMADHKSMRQAHAWSASPNLVAIPAQIFVLFSVYHNVNPIGFVILQVILLVLGIWKIILMSQVTAELHGFRSGWAGFGVMLLSGILLFVLLFILLLPVILFLETA